MTILYTAEREMFDQIKSRCQSWREMSDLTGVPLPTIENIRYGRSKIGPKTAAHLERFLRDYPGDEVVSPPRTCETCGKSLGKRVRTAKFCSQKCTEVARGQRV